MSGDSESDFSIFARDYNIPSIQSSGLVRWNTEWEKVLRTLSASDVYPAMSLAWDRGRWDPSKLDEAVQTFKDGACKLQVGVAQFWDALGEQSDQFITAWILLDKEEHKRHLLQGLKEACERASWGQDGRAMCPEITLGPMLRQRGKGFIDFFKNYSQGTQEVGENDVYFLPSEWWQNAVDRSQPLSEEVEFRFRLLTIQRNEYISRFLMHTGLSILHDLSKGSPGMDPVVKIINSDGIFAQAMGETLACMREKPLMRCENCAKTSEEIGGNVKFMVCSACRTKLDFSVHYCSPACQKEDWRNHKKNCGKRKVLKHTKGTTQDPFWMLPDDLPDHLRPPESIVSNGFVSIDSIGFGNPHPLRPHSPALQRQISLITADKKADYFLFDEADIPVRLEIHDKSTKVMFRSLRMDIMGSVKQEGLESIAQYLVKIMANKPGLSRERILDQLSREYGADVAAKLAEWERIGVRHGYGPGFTFVEMMSRNYASTLPRAMGLLG